MPPNLKSKPYTLNPARGFTLIEVLTVVAIIGLLASIILVGLGSFRARARDARRIADLRSTQNALELYYTKFSQYPVDSDWNALQNEIINSSIGVTKLAQDPLTGRSGYDQYAFDVSSDRQSYVLRAQLEDANNPVLAEGFHGFIGTPISGITMDCSNTATKPYYCVQF